MTKVRSQVFITVFVNPHSQNERIESASIKTSQGRKLSDKEYKAYFNVIPEKGKANAKLIEMLSDYFSVSKSNIEIRLGKTSKEKVVEIRGI